MLREILRGAKELGAETEMILLKEKNIKHCTGCLYCDKTKECNIEDDMTEVNRKFEKADVVVIGTPNYFDNLSGLLKDFIDRTNIFYETGKLKGKKGVAIVVGGSKIGEGSLERCLGNLKNFFEMHEMKVAGTLVASALHANEIQKNKQKMRECFELGKRLAKL
jgi:multimeric flavodoxin WrbA